MKNKAQSALLTGATLWCFSIIAAPLANLTWVYHFFSIICHQDPSRSWFILGEPLPVCIRCASVYFGFLASLWLCLPGKVTWLRVSIVMTMAEFAIARFFVDSSVLRCLSGILLGAAAAPFVQQGVEEMIRGRIARGEARASL